jgi:hypothetical protein
MLTWLFKAKSRLGLLAMDARLPGEMSQLLRNAGVQSVRQALPHVMTEFERARRHNRPIAVGVFDGDTGLRPGANGNGHGTVHPFRPAADAGLMPVMLASLLRDATRETDIVIYAAARGRCIVIMPETGAAEAREGLMRLQGLSAARIALPIRVSLAVFPDDGWTLEELIRRAEEDDKAVVRSPIVAREDVAAAGATVSRVPRRSTPGEAW